MHAPIQSGSAMGVGSNTVSVVTMDRSTSFARRPHGQRELLRVWPGVPADPTNLKRSSS